MIKFIKSIFSFQSTWVLFFLSIFSIFLTAIREIVTGEAAYLFLWWNLLLAFIPWYIATLIRVKEIRNRWVLSVLLFCWIAFFPNAPYILTDLIHLGRTWSAPIWFDLMLILSFAFTGMLYGFVSLQILEDKFLARFSKLWAGFISAGLLYMSCFGIYLGRFLRWNSWDLVENFGPIMSDIFERITDPFAHQETWGFTLLFGTFLNLIYWSYKGFGSAPSDREENPAER